MNRETKIIVKINKKDLEQFNDMLDTWGFLCNITQIEENDEYIIFEVSSDNGLTLFYMGQSFGLKLGLKHVFRNNI